MVLPGKTVGQEAVHGREEFLRQSIPQGKPDLAPEGYFL
jgi:hypothetical protein